VKIVEALRQAARRLREAGVDSPDHDAEVLLRHVLGWDRAWLVAEGARPLAPDHEAAFDTLVDERARRRPLQHLTGRQWFWKHEFHVTPDVLIPRPETELLVEAGLELLRGVDRPLILDVGTGSGCIALSLAAERLDAEVHGTEISESALGVARDNAVRLGLQGRVTFHLGDLLEPTARLAGKVDLVVCNPPYVGPDELATLAPEVRDHDPRVALVPPGDGDRFAVYRQLLPAAFDALRPGRWLVVEIGRGMLDEITSTIGPTGLRLHRVIPDGAGLSRAVIALRPIRG
jgi:release factor glutamine methyltransferase